MKNVILALLACLALAACSDKPAAAEVGCDCKECVCTEAGCSAECNCGGECDCEACDCEVKDETTVTPCPCE